MSFWVYMLRCSNGSYYIRKRLLVNAVNIIVLP